VTTVSLADDNITNTDKISNVENFVGKQKQQRNTWLEEDKKRKRTRAAKVPATTEEGNFLTVPQDFKTNFLNGFG
jgi:hypothetical protein